MSDTIKNLRRLSVQTRNYDKNISETMFEAANEIEKKIKFLDSADTYSHKLKKENEALQEQVAELVEALSGLHSLQNGAPLPTWEKPWQKVMAEAEHLIRKHQQQDKG